MKNAIKVVLACLITTALITLFLALSKSIRSKDRLKLVTQVEPSLNQVKLLNKNYSRKNSSTIIMIFDPECEHCQYELKEIKKEYMHFVNTNFYMLTTQNVENILIFAKKNNLNNFPRISLGHISNDQLYNIFGHTVIPHTFLYSSDHKLKAEFKGEFRIQALINEANK